MVVFEKIFMNIFSGRGYNIFYASMFCYGFFHHLAEHASLHHQQVEIHYTCFFESPQVETWVFLNQYDFWHLSTFAIFSKILCCIKRRRRSSDAGNCSGIHQPMMIIWWSLSEKYICHPQAFRWKREAHLVTHLWIL